MGGGGRKPTATARGRERPRLRVCDDAGTYNAHMPLITLQGVDYSVGGPLLLEHVDLTIEAGGSHVDNYSYTHWQSHPLFSIWRVGAST